MNCPHCRKGFVDIAQNGELEHDVCPDCNGTGMDPATPDPSGLCSKCSGLGDNPCELAAENAALREAVRMGTSPWRYEMDGNYMRLYTGCPVLTGDVARGYVGELAASVMCDALNTMNQCGKLPSELAAENAALRKAVRELRFAAIDAAHRPIGVIPKLLEIALTKTENL